MTDEKLADIKARLAAATPAPTDIAALIAEVARLRKRNAECQELASPVVDGRNQDYD